MNFADKTRCARCNDDLVLPLGEPETIQHLSESSDDFGRLKGGVIVIFVAVLLVGLIWLYVRKDSAATPELISETTVVQPTTQQAEQLGQVTTPAEPQSREAAKHVLAGLSRFQAATHPNMSYEEYDEMLSKLKADLNSTLPSFVDHKPEDETFRREVEAAIRDYTAARNWWKTTITNSSVLTDADRTERIIPNWTSAKGHLETAEQVLGR